LFTKLCAEYLPDVTVFHMVDESLIKDTIRNGHVRPVTNRRLLGMLGSAQDAGADAILVTCSSIGEGVKIGQGLIDVPVLRVDEAMAEKAVAAGVQVELVPSLCEGAFEAVLAGDTATHDRILTRALQEDMRGVDVVALAQASMARVVEAMGPGMLPMP